MSFAAKKAGTKGELESVLPPSDESMIPESSAPERIGRYELRFELASGGMGSVYLARVGGAAGFDKLVAIKRIHPHLAKEKGYVDMFFDEAKITSRITHPNVCTVFDFGEADGEFYLAMEYLVGEPLSRVLSRLARNPEARRDPLLPLHMARIIADASEGLHAAHELKDANGDPLHVVHRDVNPRNLFVTYDGTVQVVDFGVASARERLQHTATGQMKGSFAYMAPEQIRSEAIDRRTDVWALGVALWEALTTRRLFKRDTTANSMYAVLYEDIEPPSRFRPSVPKELDAIVLKALARDPAERWQTARAMGQALRRFVSVQDRVVGPAELSDLMNRLFPQGEARKDQLMQLARLPAAPVPSIRVPVENTLTQVTTELGEIPPEPKRRFSLRLLLALLLGGLALVAIAAVPLALQGPENAVEPVEPVAAAAIPAPSLDESAPVEPRPVADPPPEEPLEEPAEVASSNKTSTESTTRAKKPVAKRRARPKPSESAKPGTVHLVTRGGWAHIFKGGKSLGTTPQRLSLPAGRHRLVLKPADGVPKSIVVDVEAGQTQKVSIPLN